MSDEEDEKFKNLIITGAFMTDKEIEEGAPFFIVFLAIILICLFAFSRGCEGKKINKSPDIIEKVKN